MLRVIQEFSPHWVIGENVGGFITWNGGLVLDQVCSDLEAEGYEVWPFVIPACAVNAPHRRDRVWIVANAKGKQVGLAGQSRKVADDPDTKSGGLPKPRAARGRRKRFADGNCDAQNADSRRSGGRYDESAKGEGERLEAEVQDARPDWGRNWFEVASEFCGMDDGLSVEVDGLRLSKSKHRVHRLRALGNAIVPQVAIEILNAIKQTQ